MHVVSVCADIHSSGTTDIACSGILHTAKFVVCYVNGVVVSYVMYRHVVG